MTPSERKYLRFSGPERMGLVMSGALLQGPWFLIGPMPGFSVGEAMFHSSCGLAAIVWALIETWKAWKDDHGSGGP